MDTSNRRKSKQPKKVAYRTEDGGNILDFCTLERLVEQIEKKAAVDMADYEKLGEYTEQDKLAALAQVNFCRFDNYFSNIESQKFVILKGFCMFKPLYCN